MGKVQVIMPVSHTFEIVLRCAQWTGDSVVHTGLVTVLCIVDW
jgi:hypothetical protein